MKTEKGLWAYCEKTGLFGELLYIIEPMAPWIGPDWCLHYTNGYVLGIDEYGFNFNNEGIWFRNLDIGKYAYASYYRQFPTIDWPNLQIFTEVSNET